MLFDLDDTLVASRPAMAAGARHATARYAKRVAPGVAVPSDTVAAEWLADRAGWFAAYLRREVGFAEQRRARLHVLCAAVGLPAPGPRDAEAWVEDYQAALVAAARPFPDVRPCLQALAAHPGGPLRLGVVTNVDTALQVAKLERAGLAPAFEFVLGVAATGCRKPEAGAFLAGCAALGTDPGETVYVGDQLDTDALGAVAACLRGVWLDRPVPTGLDRPVLVGRPEDLPRIRGLDELPGLLGAPGG